MDKLKERRYKLIEQLKLKRKSALLVLELVNIKYLAGFTGTNGFLIVMHNGHTVFFTDFRYKDQSKEQVVTDDIVITQGDSLVFIRRYLQKIGIKHLCVEDTISYRQFRTLSFSLKLRVAKGAVELLRLVKDKEEIKHIKDAIDLAEKSFLDIKKHIKAGEKENVIARRLEESIKKNRPQCKTSFDTIVASGENSAKPHAGASEKKLEPGDLVVIDWGVQIENGYCSDMTRTFLLNDGSDGGKKLQIYDIVLKANKRAIDSIEEGKCGHDIDTVAREIIKEEGYGKYFGHGTGHGIGLNVHEEPKLSSSVRGGLLLLNTVFTVEPGIYLPGVGGVRIEDMVCLCPEKASVLTTLPKTLEILS